MGHTNSEANLPGKNHTYYQWLQVRNPDNHVKGKKFPLGAFEYTGNVTSYEERNDFSGGVKNTDGNACALLIPDGNPLDPNNSPNSEFLYIGIVMRRCASPLDQNIGTQNYVCPEIPTQIQTSMDIPMPSGKGRIEKKTPMWYVGQECGKFGCWVYNGIYYAEIVDLVRGDIDIFSFEYVDVDDPACPNSPNSVQAEVTIPALRDERFNSYQWHQTGGRLNPNETPKGAFRYYPSYKEQATKCLAYSPDYLSNNKPGVDITVIFQPCTLPDQDCSPAFQQRNSQIRSNAQTTVSLPVVIKESKRYILEGSCMWFSPGCGLKGCWIYGTVPDRPEDCSNQSGLHKAVIVAVDRVSGKK